MRTIRLMLLALLVSSGTAWAQEELTVTKIYSPAATDLTLVPTTDVILNPTGKDVLPGLGYDVNLGMLTRKYLTLHAAELWVETLVAQNTIATIGGRVLVGPTTTFVQDVGTGDTTIHVKHNQMVSGDRAYSEANAAVEFFAITSAASAHSGHFDYTVTRNLDGTGANAWTAGDALFNTGQTGNGFIDLYSVRGTKAGTEIGPTIVGNVRASATYNDWSPRWAIGNLDGLYGYSGSTYGAAFGVPSGARVTVDGTNGVRLYDGGNNLRINLTTGGSATFSGDGDNITNIDGGNIQTQTITATQIATNTINAGQINATGFGDNVIKNGNFEGADATAALSGWKKDTSDSTSSTAIQSSCCGVNGPGTLYLDPGNGFYLSAISKAFPVTSGQTYRLSMSIFANSTSSAAIHLIVYSANSSSTSIGYVTNGATGQPNDLTQTAATFMCASCAVSFGWTTVEYVYTVPASVNWASLAVYNLSGSVSGSTYTPLHFDNIELQKQIGPGHIIANSLTAGVIAADAITTSELAADSVTSAKIVAGTIVASDIASGTITGNQISAGTITADLMNVSSLSAITANVGTLTGGTIDGVTMKAGSGDEVTLDSSGITLAGGTGTNNKIKWTGGHELWGTTGGIYVNGSFSIEDVLVVGGQGTSAIDLSVDDIGIANQIQFTNMPSSTGTTVIWENSCGCLKKDSSSARYKENIRAWRDAGAQRLLNATPITFDFRAGEHGVLGLSAEDVYAVAPEVVNLDALGRPDSIRQGALNAYLLQIIKELRGELDALKSDWGQR